MPKQCIELCESILEYARIMFEPHSCGPDMRVCNMCESEIEDTYENDKYELENFPHEDDCPYVLAKELLGQNTVKEEESEKT